jgi:hypothetical protein
MVSFNKPDEVSPTDPLYYAPRQPRSVKDLSSKPFVVPEDDWAERQPVVKAMPHPLSPEIVPAPPESPLQRLSRQTKWQLAAGAFTVIVTTAGMAFVAGVMLQGVWQKGAATPLASAGSPVEQTSAAMSPAPASNRFDNSATEADASEQTSVLLQQFLNWDRNNNAAGAP